MRLFAVGEEINHYVGDPTKGNVLLVTQCDRCGRSEEQLEDA